MTSKKTYALIVFASLLLSTLPGTRANEPVASHAGNAVMINLSERDLNILLRDAFVSSVGSRIEGRRDSVSRGLSDVQYRLNLSEPVLDLEEQGRMSLRLDILEADVQIGRIERRIGKRLAHCENTGFSVSRDRPLALNAAFRLELNDGALNVVPETFSLDNTRKDLRLKKPSACDKTILPRWLLWWIGKPYLRKKIGRLDETMLTRMQQDAQELGSSGGLLHDYLDGSGGGMGLVAQTFDTSDESLLMILGASPGGNVEPSWVEELRESSFLGVSEAFLNQRLAEAFPGKPTEPSRPKGNLRKLARSRSLYTLVPGLRTLDLETTENLFFSLVFPAPRVELDRIDTSRVGLDPSIVAESIAPHEQRAVIRLLLSGVELNVWQIEGDARELLGTVRIDSGRVAVVPFVSILGGVAFELVENEWSLSSGGLEFAEHVLSATIQEMVFGEIFQTRYEPLARNALRFGEAELAPTAFRTIGDHLVIELGAGPDPAPSRTGTLLASR